MYFQNYTLSKTWFKNFLESAFSESPPIVNMLMGAKPLRNPNESLFIIYFDHSEGK